MFRVMALLAAFSALVAPNLLAQSSTLCVFQQKQGRSADVDAGFDSSLVTKELAARIPASLAMSLVSIPGFTAKEIDAEGQRRDCAWVVTMWRDELGAASPNFAGTLGGTQNSNSQGVNIMVKGTKIGSDTVLEYSLRRADSHKAIGHGEGQDDSTYAKFAEAILKKIQKEK